MLRTFAAKISPTGQVKLLEKVKLKKPYRALVTVLPDLDERADLAKLSEKALAKDWLRPEEDEAWAFLQEEVSSLSHSRSAT